MLATVSVLAAAGPAHADAITVEHSCPLQVTQATLEPGKGLDRDSLYANFFIVNPTGKEFLYTYKVQLRSSANRTDVREQVGSSPVLPHSKGWYREFIGVEFTKPSSYSIAQAIVSCVSTGS
jgi:hypothetical protein